jgi:hypothetical protein
MIRASGRRVKGMREATGRRSALDAAALPPNEIAGGSRDHPIEIVTFLADPFVRMLWIVGARTEPRNLGDDLYGRSTSVEV